MTSEPLYLDSCPFNYSVMNVLCTVFKLSVFCLLKLYQTLHVSISPYFSFTVTNDKL